MNNSANASKKGISVPYNATSKVVSGQIVSTIWKCNSNSVVGANMASVMMNGSSISVTMHGKRVFK